jgi:outer membrane protein assembly factor BamB
MVESDGVLYVLTSGFMRTLNIADGEEIWKVRLRQEIVYSRIPLRKHWYRLRDFFEDLF